MARPVGLRIAGVLFVAAFLLYGGGQALLLAGEAVAGLILTLLNSAAVIAIGVLLRPVIAVHHPAVATTYVLARSAEGVLLAVGALAWLLAADGDSGPALNAAFYRAGMAVLALGSLPFCWWLLKTRQVFAAIAWLGLLGYGLLFGGMIADHFGAATLGMVLLIPGAVFELVFAGLLIWRGLGSAAADPAPARGPPPH